MSSSEKNLEQKTSFRWLSIACEACHYEEISSWSEYPDRPDIDLHVPADLAEYKFTLMKDPLPNGDNRIGIQCYRA